MEMYVTTAEATVTWSLTRSKARMVLNFKGIPYTTEWVEYPDLAPKFKAL